MYCIFSLAVLAAVASASPIGHIYLTDIPSTSFVKHDNYMDFLKTAAFEKPIFVATRTGSSIDDLTATLIDGGYRSLSMLPKYRHLRDNLLTGEKVVFLLKPTSVSRMANSVLPVRHFILPEHLSTARSSEFAESMRSHPWIVLLDHSDLKSDLYGRLMREHAVDVTDDSVALIKSALVGYKPAHFIAGVHPVGVHEPTVHRAAPLRIINSQSFSPYAFKSLSNYRSVPVPVPVSAARSIAVPYVIPTASSEFDFQPVQRVEAIPVPVPYTIPQDSYVVQPSASAEALLNSVRLQADERSAKPTFYIVLNNDLTHAKRISEDEAIRLLTHGKMFANLEKGASSSSLESAEASSAHSAESSSSAKSGSSNVNSGKKIITKTVETITTTDNTGGIVESAVTSGANLISAGAQAIKTGASEISKASENSSSFKSSAASSSSDSSSSSSHSAGLVSGLLNTAVKTGADIVSSGASAVDNAASQVASAVTNPLGITL